MDELRLRDIKEESSHSSFRTSSMNSQKSEDDVKPQVQILGESINDRKSETKSHMNHVLLDYDRHNQKRNTYAPTAAEMLKIDLDA